MLDTVLLGVICYVIVDIWAEKRQIRFKIKRFFNKLRNK